MKDHLDLDLAAGARPEEAGALEAVALAPVAVALDGDVHGGEAALPRVEDLGGQQDRPGAGAEDRAAGGGEGAQGLPEPEGVHQLDEGGALAPGDDEGVEARQLIHLAHRRAAGAQAAQDPRVGLEVALQGQNADHESPLSAHRFNSLARCKKKETPPGGDASSTSRGFR